MRKTKKEHPLIKHFEKYRDVLFIYYLTYSILY